MKCEYCTHDLTYHVDDGCMVIECMCKSNGILN